MSFLLKRKRLASLALTWLLVLSLSLGALAHTADAPARPETQWFSNAAGVVPLSDDEMAQVSGEVNPIVAGAIVGAVGSAFNYATSPGEKSVRRARIGGCERRGGWGSQRRSGGSCGGCYGNQSCGERGIGSLVELGKCQYWCHIWRYRTPQ